MFDGVPKEVFSHYKELEAVGLAAPQVTYLMHDLVEKGIPVEDVYKRQRQGRHRARSRSRQTRMQQDRHRAHRHSSRQDRRSKCPQVVVSDVVICNQCTGL